MRLTIKKFEIIDNIFDHLNNLIFLAKRKNYFSFYHIAKIAKIIQEIKQDSNIVKKNVRRSTPSTLNAIIMMNFAIIAEKIIRE